MIRTGLVLTSVVVLAAFTPVAQAETPPRVQRDPVPLLEAEHAVPVVSTHGVAALSTAAATAQLKVRLISRTGKFDLGHAVAVETTTGQSYALGEFDAAGHAQVVVPPGQYDVNAIDVSHDPANANQPKTTTVLSESVRITGDTTVTLDATKGEPVSASVAGVDVPLQRGQIGLMSGTGQAGGTVSTFVSAENQLYAVPNRGAGQAFFFRAWLGRGAAPSHHLAFLERGGIPAELSFQVRQQDLAAVRADWRGPYTAKATPQRGSYATFDLPGTGEPRFPVYDQVVPSRTTEYYTPGVKWSHLQLLTTDDSEDGAATYATGTYRAGQPVRQEWNPAPVGPALGFGLTRTGNELDVNLALFSGANPEQFTEGWTELPGALTLHRDGVEIGRSPSADHGTFTLPTGNGTYTLRSEATRSAPWSELAPSSKTTWTFRDPAGAFVVRTSGTDGRLTLTPQSQTGTPKLAALAVAYSTDDGATWRAAPVRDGQARVDAAPGSFVSLRVFARDTAGNTVEQTVLRAYRR